VIVNWLVYHHLLAGIVLVMHVFIEIYALYYRHILPTRPVEKYPL